MATGKGNGLVSTAAHNVMNGEIPTPTKCRYEINVFVFAWVKVEVLLAIRRGRGLR